MKLRFLLRAFVAILIPSTALVQSGTPGSTDASAVYATAGDPPTNNAPDYFGAAGNRIGLANYAPAGATDVTTNPILEKTPDLQALALGLDNDPLKIFHYVRNNIESEFYFGLKKGPRLTYLEKSGNDLDKAFLLAALLRIADGNAQISIAHGMESIPYYVGDATTPDLCSLLKLDPQAMPDGQLADPATWYQQNTPYIHPALGAQNWASQSWRQTSLAFRYAAKMGYNNPSRLEIPTVSGALKIRRFYVSATNLQGATGTVLLDPWKVRYNRAEKIGFSVSGLGTPASIVPGTMITTRNLWRPDSDADRNWHKVALEPLLQSRAATLLTAFKHPDRLGSLTCDNVFGRHKLVPVTYQTINAAGVSGVSVVSGGVGEPHVIRNLAWRLSAKWEDLSEVMIYFPSLAGRRLSVHTESNGLNYSLALGVETHLFGTDFSIAPLSTKPLGSTTLKGNLTSMVLPSYYPFTPPVTVAYERNAEAPEHLRAAHSIIYGFSPGGGLLGARQARFEEMLQVLETTYPGSTTGKQIAWLQIPTREERRPVVLEALNIQGLDWLMQTALARKGIEDVFEVNLTRLASVGRMSQNGGYFIDVYQGILGNISRDGNFNEQGGEMAAAYADMFLESALEHSIVEQAADYVEMYNGLPWRPQGASTVNIISAAYSKNFYSKPAVGVLVPELGNTATCAPPILQTQGDGGGAHQPGLEVTPTPYTNFFKQYYEETKDFAWAPPPIAMTVHQGKSYFSLKAPPSTLTKGFEGGAYLSATSQKMLVGLSNGGYSTLSEPLEPIHIKEDDLFDGEWTNYHAIWFLNRTQQPTYASYDVFAADPVNVATGSFEHSEIDLKIGSGEAPMGLSFRRDYASARSRNDAVSLGFGWTHNWEIRLSEGSNGAAGLGGTIPRQMVPFFVSLKVLEDYLIPPKRSMAAGHFQGYDAESVDPRRWMVINGVAKWCVDQIANNAVTATMGKDAETFIRNPDGTYEPGSGSTMQLLVEPSGVGKLVQRHGNTISFEGLYLENDAPRRGRATKITGPHGQVVDIAWNTNNRVASVTSNAGSFVRKLVFNYSTSGSKHLTSVDEQLGGATTRSVVFTHSGGNLVSSTDPENLSPSQSSMSGGSTLYGYSPPTYGTVPCCLSYMRDPMGRDVLRNEYDLLSRVVRQDSGIIEMAGGNLLKPWSFRYAGVMNQEIDPLGGIKRYFYNDNGRLVRQEDALGLATTTEYDAEDRVTAVVDPRGARVETSYDVNHNVTATREYRNGFPGASYLTTTTYDTLLRPWVKTDPLGRVTTFSYHPLAAGQTPVADPATVTQGNNQTTSYNYYPPGTFSAGLLQSEVDIFGTAATYTYDYQGNPAVVSRPGSAPGGMVPVITTCNLQGDPGSVTDENGRVDTYIYNKRRQVIGHTRTDSGNPMYSLSESSLYDAAGRLAIESQATGRGGNKTKGYEYLTSGKPTYTRHGGADGVLWTSDDSFELKVYDEREFLVKEFDANGNFTETNYLANGWKDSVELPVDPKLGSRITSSEYDSAGRVTSASDVLSRETATVYAQHESVTLPDTLPAVIDRTTVTGPDSVPTSEWKDAMGNLRVVRDKRGQSYQMNYDAWERLTKTITPENRFFQTTYLADGRVDEVIKGNAATSIVADSSYSTNRLLSSVSWPGKTVTYDSYDSKGNLLAATEAGKTVARTYDYFDRVRTYKNGDGWMIGYEYYNDGMLKRIYYPDSATDTNPFDNDSVLYNYDQQGRLLTITDWAARVTTYSWRTDGRLNSITRPNGTVRKLTYDSLSRVVGFTERNASGTLIHVQRLDYRKTEDLASSYTYPAKPAGGGTTPVSLTSAVFGNDNTLASANGHTLATDSRGNLTSALLDSSGTPATLTFDERDRLTGIDSAADTSFVYDLEGNRRSMTHAGSTTNYVFDPHGGSLIRMLVRIDQTGRKVRYVYGIGLDYEVDQVTSQAKYYHYDFTGSTAAITDQTGAVTDRYYYSPYGQLVYSTGSTDTPFKFSGFMGVITDPNGLLSMRARFYSPVLCRFISMDPAKFEGGMNWYAYASGNPLTLGDPTGFGPESTLDTIQTGLSLLGMTPVLGAAFDLLNAGISLARGNYADAALNTFSALPGIGDLAAGAKIAAGGAALYGGYKGASAISRSSWHSAMNAKYTWGSPPGGHWTQGVSHKMRKEMGLVGSGKELHHWLIPQSGGGRSVPNYIKNQPWNIKVADSRAAHAKIDTAFSVRGVAPYPLAIRPWMAMPNWARGATVGTGIGLGYGASEFLYE